MSNPKNLIGNPLSDNVLNQIKARVSLQSTTGFQDDKAIDFKARSHNAFVKLSSFVTLDNAALAKAVNSSTGVALARNWTLFNGRAGTGNGVVTDMTEKNRNQSIPDYGVGGVEELGIRPMPGIISIDVTPAGTAGSVRRATVKFRCHNLNQLDIIDVLYFRFGFSMLLEWGHTMYANNDLKNPKVEIAQTPIDVFGRDWDKEEVLRELAKRRESSHGNYDGMLGLVTNYEWSMTPDGGYDCTLNLTGIGSIVESLKINGSDGWPMEPLLATPFTPAGLTGATGTPGSSGYTSALTNISATLGLPQKVTNTYGSSLAAILTKFKEYALQRMDPASFQTKVAEAFKTGLDLGNNPTDAYKKGYNAGYMSGLHTAVADVDFTKVYTYHAESFKGASELEGGGMAFIPLSLLLAAINNTSTAYDKKSKRKTTPLLYVDFNPDTNFCFRLEDQISLDPTVCLISSSDPTAVFYNNWLTKRGVVTSQMNPPVNTTEDTGVMFNLNNQVAAGVLGSFPDTINKVSTRANIMNILVNIDCALNLLGSVESSDTASSVYLSTFLSELMTRIAGVTGNVNKFTVTYDDESNVVRILDEQLTHNEQAAYPTLPVFGLSSAVRSMTFKTETSTKIGSMLAIEAMAAERHPSTDGRDGSAFSALNSRIRDRLITLRERRAGDTATAEDVISKANLFAKYRSELYRYGMYNSADVMNNVSFYSECMNGMKTELDKSLYGTSEVARTSTSARGILPLSLNLTMDGISNMRLYEGFTLDVSRLPAQYKDGSSTRVGFVIFGLSHSVQGQSWITTIRANMVNIPSQKTTPPAAFVQRKQAPPSGGGGKGLTIPLIPGGFSTKRDNNPFDLIATPNSQKYKGVIGYKVAGNSGLKFLVFDTYTNGTRAGLMNLKLQFTKYNIKTIRQLINRYAPPGSPGQSAADTARYIVNVTNDMKKWYDPKITADTVLSFAGATETNPNNIKMFKNLAKSIVKWEGGLNADKIAAIDGFSIKDLA